jgi:hypothetical protein
LPSGAVRGGPLGARLDSLRFSFGGFRLNCFGCRRAFAFDFLWRLGGLAFGGSRAGYCLFLIFEMICQISLTPRPSTAENGTGC